MNNQSDNNFNKTTDLSALSFFGGDPYFNFVHKKSERLCMAIYLISDFFPANDSLKDSMRKAGTELMRVSLSLISSSSSFRKDVLNDISRLCLEIISLSKVATHLGMSSSANHDVLESEIKNFIGVIEEREKPSATGQGFVLDKDVVVGYFNDDKISNPADLTDALKSAETADVKLKVEFDTYDVAGNVAGNVVKKSIANVSENQGMGMSSYGAAEKAVDSAKAGRSESVEADSIKSYSKPMLQKNDRQQVILDTIREMGETSIKDISDNIKGCSEKTIQRELNSLIYGGVLKKIGERRWSKYILA